MREPGDSPGLRASSDSSSRSVIHHGRYEAALFKAAVTHCLKTPQAYILISDLKNVSLIFLASH
jgi:hypothetical protein